MVARDSIWLGLYLEEEVGLLLSSHKPSTGTSMRLLEKFEIVPYSWNTLAR
jgi:hypothetical protein